MLGSVSRDYVFGLLDALSSGDGAMLLKRIGDLAERAPDFGGVLDELLRILHNIALMQIIGTTGEESPETGKYKIRRGGGWRSLGQDLRVTNRASGEPRHYFDGQMGFRCAMSLPKSAMDQDLSKPRGSC